MPSQALESNSLRPEQTRIEKLKPAHTSPLAVDNGRSI
jgi:hypothetical protein